MLSAGAPQTFRTPSTGASHEIERPSGDNFAPKNVGLSNSLRRGMRGRADMLPPVGANSRMAKRQLISAVAPAGWFSSRQWELSLRRPVASSPPPLTAGIFHLLRA